MVSYSLPFWGRRKFIPITVVNSPNICLSKIGVDWFKCDFGFSTLAPPFSR